MTKKLHIKIITPEKVLLDTDAAIAVVPTIDGIITILPEHINLITKLTEGELKYKTSQKASWEYLLIFGGILSIYNDQVNILAKSAVKAQEIDVAQALKAKEEAEKLLSQKLEKVKFAEVEAGLKRALMELELAKKYKRVVNLPH
ncbi:MAG: ATP synthase F1 subunit epsilon [bacterium]|nr:ATP synthase F1 subunit epsilon [bacterium]